MTIDRFIDRDYFTILISAEPAFVAEYLQERSCLAVCSESLDILGIVTVTDVHPRQNRSLARVDFEKPVLSPRTSVKKAIQLMKISRQSFLPVYRGKRFIGILSLFDLAEYLIL